MTAFTDPGYLAAVEDGILTALSTGFTVAGRPVDRAFRSAGTPAWDCSQLAVWSTVRVVSPGTRTDPNPMLRQIRLAADVSVLVTRCMAAAAFENPPPADVLDADGAALATDMWVITQILTHGVQAATLGLPGGCMVARLNPVAPSIPSGGFYGVTTTLEVALG